MSASDAELAAKLRGVGETLERSFLGKSEIVRLILIAAIAGEHAVLIGPPGTAKSALIRRFAELVHATYFEYLVTRFTEPNEIFGPIDIQAFREGRYERRTEGMLAQAEVVFLDEVFKANSAILNSLLGVLNERRYAVGATVQKVPLISAFGASNDVPNDEDMMAVFDRFLIRIKSDNLESYHFAELLQKGLQLEAARHREPTGKAMLRGEDFRIMHERLSNRLRFGNDFVAAYKGLIFQIRAEGIFVSDRRAVKLLKLFAASAFLDGRTEANPSDFFILRHIWNSPDQASLLEAIVAPTLDAWFQRFPESQRFGAVGVGLDALIAEIERVRAVITSERTVSDVQLFSHLKSLTEIKGALQTINTEPAREAKARVEQLLGQVLQSGRFNR